MFFNSTKEVNRLRKEINRSLIKGILNIYLKVAIEKNWRSQNFDFLSLKTLPPGQFLGSSNSPIDVMMADGRETSVKIILNIYYAISTIRKVQHSKLSKEKIFKSERKT